MVGLKLTLDAYSAGGGATPPPSGGALSSPAFKLIGCAAAATCLATWAAAGGVLEGHTPYLGGAGAAARGLAPVPPQPRLLTAAYAALRQPARRAVDGRLCGACQRSVGAARVPLLGGAVEELL